MNEEKNELEGYEWFAIIVFLVVLAFGLWILVQAVDEPIDKALYPLRGTPLTQEYTGQANELASVKENLKQYLSNYDEVSFEDWSELKFAEDGYFLQSVTWHCVDRDGRKHRARQEIKFNALGELLFDSGEEK